MTANYAGGSITLFDVDRKGELVVPIGISCWGIRGYLTPKRFLFSPNGRELLRDKGQDRYFTSV